MSRCYSPLWRSRWLPGVLVAIPAAAKALSTDIAATLNSGGNPGAPSGGERPLARALRRIGLPVAINVGPNGLLVVAEIALAMVLLVGAGLLLNSFLRLAWLDPGYDASRVVAITLRADPDAAQPLHEAALD